MGGPGCSDDSPGGIPSQYFKTGCGDDILEGRRQVMGVDLGGHTAVIDRALTDEVVREESTGNNYVVLFR